MLEQVGLLNAVHPRLGVHHVEDDASGQGASVSVFVIVGCLLLICHLALLAWFLKMDMDFVSDDYGQHNRYFYTSFEEGLRELSSSHDRFVKQTEEKIEELNHRRSCLLRELQQLEHPSVVFEGQSNVLSIPAIRGFVLSNFSREEKQTDNSTIFSADGCMNSKKFFTLRVVMKEEKVIQIDLELYDNSPLWEIKTVLDMLLKKNCPSLLLLIIQRFLHMNSLRKTVVLKLITGPNKRFRVFLPQNTKNGKAFCEIQEQKNDRPVLAVKWTMLWSQEYNSLVHSFTCENFNDLGEQDIVKYLVGRTFWYKNEEELVQLWLRYQGQL